MSAPLSASTQAPSSSIFREWSYAEQWQSRLEQHRHSHLHDNTIIQALSWHNYEKEDESLLLGCTRQGHVCAWRVMKGDANPATSSSTSKSGTGTDTPIWRLHVGTPLYAMQWSKDRSQLCAAGEGGVFVLDGTKILYEINAGAFKTEKDKDTEELASSDYVIAHLATHTSAQTIPTVIDLYVDGNLNNGCRVYYGAARDDAFGAYRWTAGNVENNNNNNHRAEQGHVMVRTVPATSAGHGGRFNSVTSLDLCGSVLATGDSTGVVTLWDTNTLDLSNSTPQKQQKSKPIQTLIYDTTAADGSVGYRGNNKRPVVACRFWKSGDGNMDPPDWLVVAYSHSIGTTATGTASSQLVMWHLPSESCVASVETTTSITCLYLSQAHIYTGANDGRVSVWTPFDLQCPFVMTTSVPAIYAMALSSSNGNNGDSNQGSHNHLAVAGVGATVDLWDEHGLLKHRLQL